MKSLFIDTHDADIIVCLYQEGNVVDKKIKASKRNHSDYTMPLIKELLEANNTDVHDLAEIFVVNGPGSFTGVRLGVTIAKTLAYTLNIPIKTISSLEAIAISYSSQKMKMPIIRDIKGVFGGIYSKDNKQVEELFYKSNEEFAKYCQENQYDKYIIEKIDYDFEAIYNYMKEIKPTNAHQVNPLYIKKIEALKND